jgi:hypothetical protein
MSWTLLQTLVVNQQLKKDQIGKVIPVQAVEARRFVRRRGSHIFYTIDPESLTEKRHFLPLLGIELRLPV